MKVRLTSISIHQTALMLAVLEGLAGLVGALFFGAIYLAQSAAHVTPSTPNPSGFVLILLPILYFILGYIGTAIAAWLYNLLARSIGGIEFTLQNVGDQVVLPVVP